MSDRLPIWVYDVVVELERWTDNHPQLHGKFFDMELGQHVMKPVDDCGCKALSLVQSDVREGAQFLAFLQVEGRASQP